MASGSGFRAHSAADRIATAATTLYSENHSLLTEMRKSLGVMKDIAMDAENHNQSDQVKRLDGAVIELLESFADCSRFSEAVEAIGQSYPQLHDNNAQPTDFRKLLEGEVARLKTGAPSNPQSHPLYRQFKEAIWKVHHDGLPMPGEEQEDIVMTCSQMSLLNVTCPLTGKPVVELEHPVRCMDCKHIYEKGPILHFIGAGKGQALCPVAGCPKILEAGRVVCDPLLPVEIEEMRAAEKSYVPHSVVEDFTLVDDDDE